MLKDKALRDQAFECLSEERQQAIAMAVVRGEKVSWEQEGWEAMMDTQRSVLKGKNIPSIVDVVTPPSPEETELSWYEHTKIQHPTLSAEDAWQLAVHNRSRARPPAIPVTGEKEASGSGSSGKLLAVSASRTLSPFSQAFADPCSVLR